MIEGKLILLADTVFLFILTSEISGNRNDIINSILIYLFIILYSLLVGLDLKYLLEFYPFSM